MKPSWGWVLVLSLAGVPVVSGQEKTAFKLSDGERQLLDLTNRERKKKDLEPLQPSERLFKIARAHSENMAKQRKMEHNLDGKTPFDRIRAGGYLFAKGGENIADGDSEVALPGIMKAWMESKSHRENILLPEFTEIGLGIARDASGHAYYTQVFAKPRKQ